MNNKTLAMVSYVTIIGWLVAYFSYKSQAEKSSLVSYHLEQSLGIFICSIAVSVVAGVLISVIPVLSTLFSLLMLLPLVLLILGIINASHEAKKPVPLTGRFFERKFSFLA